MLPILPRRGGAITNTWCLSIWFPPTHPRLYLCLPSLAPVIATWAAGVPSYNDVRRACGFSRVTTFEDITSDYMIQGRLANTYGDVELLDAYTGALAENEDGSGLFAGPLLRVRWRQSLTFL